MKSPDSDGKMSTATSNFNLQFFHNYTESEQTN